MSRSAQPAVSPFLSESNAPSFGARFQLAPTTSLQRPGTAAAAAKPATPFQRALGLGSGYMDASASPFASPSPSPRASGTTSGAASPVSPGLQSPNNERGWGGGWGGAPAAGSAAASQPRFGGSASPTASPSPSHTKGGLSFGNLSSSFGNSFNFKFGQPQQQPQSAQQSPYPNGLNTPKATSKAAPTYSYAAAATAGAQSTPSYNSAVPSNSSRISSSNSGSGSHTAASSVAAQSLSSLHPTASATKFSHPDLERIATQLAYVTTHKTLFSLLLSSSALVVGFCFFLYILLLPLPLRVSIPLLPFTSALSISLSRDLVQGSGLLLALFVTLVGATGLIRYLSLKLPLKEIESLSERQRALMGWNGASSGSSNAAFGSRDARQRQPSRSPQPHQLHSGDEGEDGAAEQYADRNALRARARVQQLTGTTPAHNAAALAAAKTATSLSSRSTHQSASHSSSRSPIPVASLRHFVNGSSGGSTNVAASDLLRGSSSPYKSRGLASGPSAAGVAHARSIGDEISLSHFAHEYDGSHQQRRGGAASHGKQNNSADGGSSGSSSGGHVAFNTPNRAAAGSSPRHSSSYGGFGGFGSGSPAALTTPPYATSLRELAAATPVSSSLSFAAAAASGAGQHGGVGSHSGGGVSGSTFSFALPGHRFPLDDPRADADLHEQFHAQLRGGGGSSLRLTAAQIDQYARNMRSYIVTQILRPLLHSLDSSNAAMGNLAVQLLAQPGVASAFTAEQLNNLRGLAQSYGNIHSAAALPPLSAQLADGIALLVERFPARPECSARINVDKFLSVEQAATAGEGQESVSALNYSSATAPPTAGAVSVSSATRAYVAQRLQSLCSPGDDSLSKFQLSAGGGGGAAMLRSNAAVGLFGTRSSGVGTGAFGVGSFSAASAPPSLLLPNGSSIPAPSDSQIILHCFCIQMEGVRSGFRSQFIKEWRMNSLTHARMPSAVQNHSAGETVAIAQVRPPSLQPYYILTHSALSSALSGGGRREAVKSVTEPGRSSLFQALVLFALEQADSSPIKRELAAVIGRG